MKLKVLQCGGNDYPDLAVEFAFIGAHLCLMILVRSTGLFKTLKVGFCQASPYVTKRPMLKTLDRNLSSSEPSHSGSSRMAHPVHAERGERNAIPKPPRWLWGMVSLVFLATGAAGLAYEVVWTRWLELLLGSSTWAATAVLAAFMGGLALGGALFGKIADRVERRLSLYGWLEIGVGLYGLAFPVLLRASTGLYVSLASSFAENAPLTFALRFTLALALVLVPTTLMGGTLPILVRHLAQDEGESDDFEASRRMNHPRPRAGWSVGRGVAWLYFINSAGAVCGCIVAGFFTIGRLGLLFTSTLAVLINVVAGVTVLIFRKWGETGGTVAVRSRTPNSAASTPGAEVGTTPSAGKRAAAGVMAEPSVGTGGVVSVPSFPEPGASSLPSASAMVGAHRSEGGAAQVRVLLSPEAGGMEEAAVGMGAVATAAVLSGAAAMAYEIVWFRLLALVLGSSTDAFSLMLATFIGGLALGSLWIGRRIDRWVCPARAFFLIQCGIGLLVLVTLPMTGVLPELSIRLRGFAQGSYGLYQVLEAGLCSVLMVAPTFLLGVSFPLLARLAGRAAERGAEAGVGARGLGNRLGRLVASTTAGNIAGTLAAGLVLIPAIGSRWTAVAAALSSVAAGCVVEWKARPGGAGLTRIAGAAATAGAVIALAPGWSTRLLTAAPFREGQTTQDSVRQYRERQRLHEVVFVREDAGGTVSVDRDGDNLTLRVNGKPDASLAMEDMLTQRLLGHYPMLFHQDPKQVMIVGIGSGVTAGAVLRHPVEGVTVAEISEGVAEASRLFEAANHAYWRDPRLRLRLEDARNVLLIEPARYDVIISEPSNLWMAGVATLYTQEFYKLVSSRMRPHGIFLQWVHSYEMSEDDLKLVFRTLLSVFPHATAFRSSPGDLQILASVEPFSWDFPRIERAIARPEVRADLAPFGLEDVLTLLAQEEIPEPEFVAYAGSGRIHVDDWPLLEKSTPKSLFNKTGVTLPEMEFRLTNPHALVRRYMAGREPTPDELYRLARAATLAGPSNNIVLGYLEAAIRAEPGYRPASWLLAEIHAHRGDYSRAVSVLERLTAVAPPVAEDYERLGTYALEEARRKVGFFRAFDPSSARRVFERCLELDPNRAVCLHGTNVGVSLSALGPGTLPVRP